jgi:YfiH family protein
MNMGSPAAKAGAVHPWLAPAWDAPRNVHALFTTRAGGVSRGARATLDLGAARLGDSDDVALVAENRRRLAGWLPAAPIWLRQVHGADVVIIDAGNAGDFRVDPPEADAAVTRTPGIVLSVRTADCLPVLLTDREGDVIGVAHAGWRGLAAGVLEATLAAMAVPRSEVLAWLGPAIGPTAFEVGRDVFDAFGGDAAPVNTCFAPRGNGKWLADLPALAQLRLEQAGVDCVRRSGQCTFSDAARYFSFRRERDTGRMGAFIWRDSRSANG